MECYFLTLKRKGRAVLISSTTNTQTLCPLGCNTATEKAMQDVITAVIKLKKPLHNSRVPLSQRLCRDTSTGIAALWNAVQIHSNWCH